MAKKTVTIESTMRVKIYSPFFSGYLDEMPIEAKDRMKAEKPEVHKMLFEKDVVVEPII